MYFCRGHFQQNKLLKILLFSFYISFVCHSSFFFDRIQWSMPMILNGVQFIFLLWKIFILFNLNTCIHSPSAQIKKKIEHKSVAYNLLFVHLKKKIWLLHHVSQSNTSDFGFFFLCCYFLEFSYNDIYGRKKKYGKIMMIWWCDAAHLREIILPMVTNIIDRLVWIKVLFIRVPHKSHCNCNFDGCLPKWCDFFFF